MVYQNLYTLQCEEIQVTARMKSFNEVSAAGQLIMKLW